MASRIPVVLLPPKRSSVRKHRGVLWLSGEKLHIDYKPKFSLPGKPVEHFEVPFEEIKRAAYDEGIFDDKLLLVFTDLEALDQLPTADRDSHRILLEIDKDDREEAKSLVSQLQLDKMGDIFEDMLDITDLMSDPLTEMRKKRRAEEE